MIQANVSCILAYQYGLHGTNSGCLQGLVAGFFVFIIRTFGT
ncbi:hypothetical protein HanXRQr2_Chr12g0529211 [Helianthus annuus]|uniref:Uncharacterized protein n=1 Tax=Helianthus annuus TaxID=4232 RepID=A0A9K3EP14_HELAN|nr:hypothetical protein HanXRQr2_Chr12g0529211 [Helianthus annuus]